MSQLLRLALVALALLLLGDGSFAAGQRGDFLFFWGHGCPHCAEARPFVKRLEQDHPKLRFEAWEVRKDPKGRRRFAEEVKRLGIPKPGVPAFVCGEQYVVGFRTGETEPALRALAQQCEVPRRKGE